MQNQFNLVDQRWIPCVPRGGGTTRRLGLAQLFKEADQWQRIHHESPLVTVALHRLLLAIVHRVLGELNATRLVDLYQDGLPTQQILDYLESWKHRFNLFDSTHPFYQVGDMEMKKNGETPLNRMALELAGGNGKTLFDHSSDLRPPALKPADAALVLVGVHSYANPLGVSPSVYLKGTLEKRPNYADPILFRGLTIWLTGKNVRETLLLNLVSGRTGKDDIPCWERDEPEELRDRKTKSGKMTVSAEGIVDLYTWQSRMVLLIPEKQNGDTVVRNACFAQGRIADKEYVDPMKAYVKSKKTGYLPLAVSQDRAVWRNAQALFVREDEDGKRPQIFASLKYLVNRNVISGSLPYVINAVGIASAPNKAAKVMLWRHDKMITPAALFNDDSLVAQVKSALETAETVVGKLRSRLRRAARMLLTVGDHKPDPDQITATVQTLQASENYWATLETHFNRFLLDLADAPRSAFQQWCSQVEKAAQEALEQALQRLGGSTRAVIARARTYTRFKAIPESQNTDSNREVTQ